MRPKPTAPPGDDDVLVKLRVLARYRRRLRRRLEALREDLSGAERAGDYRRFGEALLAYLKQVPPRAARVVLPDPADHNHNLEIELDPALRPQENAARYFRRASKAERGLKEIPPRLAAVEAELLGLEHLLERAMRLDEHAPIPEGGSVAHVIEDVSLATDIDEALKRLPPVFRQAPPLPRSRAPGAKAPRLGEPASSGRLQPRRLKSREGWDVLIGRSNEGNDYLTHQLARPEDYWFHVRGAAGSHVVLRRGKGKNEPSKRTLEEVGAWAAFYSQARTAGSVPVIVTLKKYVRKPRKAPPGLALCEREKTLMVRPHEPPKDAMPAPEEAP